VFPERTGAPFPALRGTIDRLWIGWDYDHRLRRIIHLFKFHQRLDFAELLVREFLKALPDPAAAFDIDILIPVPIHPARRRYRGFNQSERLAGEISTAFGLEVDNESITRVINTPSQTILGRKDRWHSVRNAFAISSPGKFENKRIVIIDDLATSGATLHALANLLRTCNPGSVDAAVLASPYGEGQAI
jgi:ComF family protein